MKISIGKIRPNNFNSNEMSVVEYERFKVGVVSFGMKDPIEVLNASSIKR